MRSVSIGAVPQALVVVANVKVDVNNEVKVELAEVKADGDYKDSDLVPFEGVFKDLVQN